MALTQGATPPLSAGGLPSDSTINLLTGNVAGPLGCCAILVIVACGLYLLVRGHMQLSTFVPYLAVCVLVPWLLPNLNELPALSAPWEYVRQRIYLEKYILLSGSMLFGGIFLACEPVVQPNRWSSRLIYGLFLGRQWQRRSAITAYTKPAYALPLYWLVLSLNGWTAWPSAQKGSDSCGRRKSALPNTENRKNSNKKPTLQEHSQTVIIPQLTPEMLEQARRAAEQGKTAEQIEQEALAAAQAEQKAVESKQEAPTAEKPKTVQPANKPKTRKEAEEELAQNIHDDHLWLNNPVMVRGLGLAPIVAAAVSGQNAWCCALPPFCL